MCSRSIAARILHERQIIIVGLILVQSSTQEGCGLNFEPCDINAGRCLCVVRMSVRCIR